MVTFMPKSAARNAAAYPPGPPPITATRKFGVFDIVVFLSLNGQQEWLLEGFRNPAQETRGVGAIDQPVIVREREWQNQARLKFVVDPLRFHPGTRQSENRDFGMIHDRRKSGAADSTKVSDCKGTAAHFFGRELLVLCLPGKLRKFGCQFDDILLVHFADDRHQQATIGV